MIRKYSPFAAPTSKIETMLGWPEERCGRPRFLRETRYDPFVLSKIGGEHFYGKQPAMDAMFGAIDFRHSSASNPIQDFVFFAKRLRQQSAYVLSIHRK